jgi:hypothetical protein
MIPVDAHRRVIDGHDRILDLWGDETLSEGGAHQTGTEVMGTCCGWFRAGEGSTHCGLRGCGRPVGRAGGCWPREGWQNVEVSSQRPCARKWGTGSIYFFFGVIQKNGKTKARKQSKQMNDRKKVFSLHFLVKSSDMFFSI